eukprot:1719386-Pleurochrysis_carterae.AAC.1
MLDIYDDVAHREERFRREQLGEEVGQIGRAAHKRDSDIVRFHALAHKEVASVNVLRTLMVFW